MSIIAIAANADGFMQRSIRSLSRSDSGKNTPELGIGPLLATPLATCILYTALGHENNLTAQ